MKVKNWIHKQPITVNRMALLQEAVHLMKQHNIRHLPVVDDDDDLVGFVTESDLRQFSFPSMIEEIPVHQVMVTNPRTINANDSIEEAARIIHDKKIGGLPVLDNGRLVGVITASDLLSAFIEVMGLLKSTTRIDVLVNEEKGGLEMVTKIIKSHDCDIVNVAMDSTEGKKKVYYFRLEHCDAEPLVKDLETAGHQVLSVMD
jgi:acetoin utilization protein AcuB